MCEMTNLFITKSGILSYLKVNLKLLRNEICKQMGCLRKSLKQKYPTRFVKPNVPNIFNKFIFSCSQMHLKKETSRNKTPCTYIFFIFESIGDEK